MKKHVTLLVLALLGWACALGQSIAYGNDWYRNISDRDFVKLVVDQDGIYRVSAADLTNAGVDLSGVDPRFLQLHYRGKEVPIFVTNTPSGELNYLEFFGRLNDGRVDSAMYRNPVSGVHDPRHQPNIHRSIFSDESAYFLSWNQTVPGQRYFDYLDIGYSLLPAEPSFWYESFLDFDPQAGGQERGIHILAGGGPYDSYHSLNSDYVTGEGIVSAAFFQIGRPYTFTLETPAAINDGRPMEIQSRVFGRSNTEHHLRVLVNGNSSLPLLDTVIDFNSIYTRTYTREYITNLGNQTDLTFEALRSPTDNNHLCWASIGYHRDFDLRGAGEVKISRWTKNTNARMRFTNVDGNDSVFVYDLSGRVRSRGLMTGANVGEVIVFQNSGADSRNLYFATDKAIRSPRIEAPQLNKLYDPAAGAEFVIVSNRSLQSSAEAYRQYRDTCQVNPLSVKLVYTDEIYDEYGYGSPTSWAIKRFCKDAIDNWQVKPRYFLFWGKGKTWYRGQDDNLVPTFGYPATDYEFVSRYDQNTPESNVYAAVGRVNIYDNQEGMAYLNKLKTYEYAPFEPWMKTGVFLGGGATIGEQDAISNAFGDYIDIYTGQPFGGEAVYFQKRTVGIGDGANAGYHDNISEGVSLIHFFGHSSSNLLDISIREAFEYTNYGRYPLMIAMGCYGGDFAGRESFGERWVKEPERGCIAYLANSSAGYLNPLRDYARVFYPFRYQSLLNQPIGDAIKETFNTYVDSLPGLQYRNHARQMNLQGDPSLRLYYPKKPDLVVSEDAVFFTPLNFTAQDDSFTINVIVQNEGLVTEDSFDLRIRQILPDRTDFLHGNFRYPMVRNRDTLSLVLYNPVGNLMAGENRFEIFVDAREEIEESDESNNLALINRIVPGNIPATLYPPEYAVVGKSQIHLDASAFFMTRDEEVRYLFEIDTTAEFSSPQKLVSPVVVGTGNHVRWDVPFSLVDSTVYYWRVRLLDAEPSIWGTSSFKYIANRTGWAQSQAAQFVKNETERTEMDALQREWRFQTFSRTYAFEIFPIASPDRYQFLFSIENANASDIPAMARNVLYFTIVSKDSLRPIFSKEGQEGRMRLVSDLQNDLYLLENAIRSSKKGDFVMLAGVDIPDINAWPEAVFELMTEVGMSEDIKNLPAGGSFLSMGRKGYPGSAIEVTRPNSGAKYRIDQQLFAPFASGQVSSPRIGPAQVWGEVFWDWRSIDQVNQEEVNLNITGIRADNSDSLIAVKVPRGAPLDLSAVDARRFPYLQFSAQLRDTLNRTAPQLDNWHVLYVPAPDAVVDPITDFIFESDTVQEGEDIRIRMGAINVSDYNMDSLKVKFTAIRPDRVQVLLDTFRTAPLLAGGRVTFEYSFNTLEKKLEGDINLVVEINPDNDQPEKYTFNNLFIQPFRVEIDERNPVLDVTFDGKRIIDGDIITPRPEILIQVNDENPYVPITDTSAFEVYFYEDRAGEGRSSDNRVAIASNPKVEWRPASLPDNKAELTFRPGLTEPLPNGDYILAVQAKDQKGNASGAGESFYEISFKVINEATITQVVNYPNPFSTSTRFVYTLTGSELPSKFQIHIFTVSGKIVKVIDLLAMGDVNYGRNITEYAWDGTDEFGDPLGNGVYLYRVILETPGEEFSVRDEGTSQYFNNGWGKMYLMR
jgi:hypothetical protein